MGAPRPITVKGPSEGALVLKVNKEGVHGVFDISLTDTGSPKTVVLYRLRVKESSILFSKTYGLLETGCSPSDRISIYAMENVAQAGRLSTIRVEYLTITPVEAQTVLDSGVDKNSCRPFFQRQGVHVYDVSCSVAPSTPAWVKYAVIGGAALAGVAAVAAVLSKKKAAARAAAGN